TLPTCLAEGEQPKYAPMTVIDNIRAKLAGSRKGRINSAAGSEAGRILAAAGRPPGAS
ncbi:isopenicillin N synthase family oxygenase, partial [Arthrobacter deserti]|nr:isopenicillin N synthase family oxygenase [Arthrobacter deserti]